MSTMNKDTPISKDFRLTADQVSALAKLGIKNVEDLLYHFPHKYTDSGKIIPIKDAAPREKVTLSGTISELELKKGFKTKIPMATGRLSDFSGEIELVWFHQPYIAKMLKDGMSVILTGQVSERRATKKLYISNAEFEVVDSPLEPGSERLFNEAPVDNLESAGVGYSYASYPESRGITSKWIHHAIKKILSSGTTKELRDPLPKEILEKYHLPSLENSLIYIHTPKKSTDAEVARKRFAFEEIFFIQLEKQMNRKVSEKSAAWNINTSFEDLKKFSDTFGFPLTEAQRTAINTILSDFKKDNPMSRLLEGDVGSGKTAVAAASTYAIIKTRPSNKETGKIQNFGTLQVAYMCPTEILAKQHFHSFIQYFKNSGINIGLITGKECRKFPSKVNPSESTNISKAQLKKWVANGEIAIVIGTHALIQKSVQFKHLAYIIIDEQHRFGVNDRQKLTEKNHFGSINGIGNIKMPHLLSMTATPIPRTLALTIYGDLDLTLLDSMPAGRKPIITEIIEPSRREKTYDFIKEKLNEGRQLYIICPRINEPDPDKEMALVVKSVTEEAKRLKKEVFRNETIEILHSKMAPKTREAVMNRFSKGETKILVATSLVEVGVNVPNATMIIIEGAERFGLAQLHQLRGRVVRSNHQAYCFVFADIKSDKTLERLRALTSAKNGFELAEYDLNFRGAGALSGGKQWGMSDIAMEALQNIKMVEAARIEAGLMVENKDWQKNNPGIIEEIARRKRTHFE